MASIGLSIIAKNEAAVIERCLRSVMPICDYYIVNDTGSTDGTQDKVRAFLADHGLPGRVVETSWQGFAFNRTAALAEMRRHADIDYCLMIDADEQLFYEPGFDPAAFKAGLTADWYEIQTELSGVNYLRPQLTRNAVEFSYRAVLHEFLHVPEGQLRSEIARGLVNRPTPDGARSSNPNKYQDDSVLLWEELKREEDPFLRRRYQFYLAQSLRDSREWDAAIEAYEMRATMGGWQEEIFVALYESAKMRARQGHDEDVVIGTFLRAHDASPDRAESLVAAARYARERGRHATAYTLARRAMDQTPPPAALFAELSAYSHLAKDEASVAAFWIGRLDESLQWFEELLASDDLPDEHRARVAANRDLAVRRIAEQEKAAAPVLSRNDRRLAKKKPRRA